MNPDHTLHSYTRVSSSSQEEEGTSLETQKELGLKKSEELGFEFKLWNEGGQSSRFDDLENRPVLLELISEIDSGTVKHLFVYNTDRLSRNQKTWGLIRYKLLEHGVTLHTPSGKMDLKNPIDDLLMGILSEISSYDNKVRTERSRLGKLNKIKQGFWLGGPPPYGYKVVDKKLVVNEKESKWVEFIFEQYRDGKTIREIRMSLMEKGVHTRRKNPTWSFGSITKLLQNSHFSGYYEMTDKLSGQTVRVDCPTVISPTLVNDVRSLQKKRSQIRTKEPNLKRFYLLRELLFCDHCGSWFSGRIYEKQYRSVYYCPRKQRNFVYRGDPTKDKKCENSRYLKIESTDNLVWDEVTDVLSQSHLYKEEIKKEILRDGDNTHQFDKVEMGKLKKKLRLVDGDIHETRKTLINLETDRLLKKRSPEEVIPIINNIDEHLLSLRGKREELTNEIRGFESHKKWVDWVSQFRDRFDELNSFSPEEKKDFLVGIIEKIGVKTIDSQTHQLDLTFKIPVVGDKLVWKDRKNKSKGGYEIIEGGSSKKVLVDSGKLKKKENEVQLN